MTWKRCFFVEMVASNKHSDVQEEDEEEELFALQYHLDCMWRSCWLATVACVGLFSSAYPTVFVFFQFLVDCLHHRLAACIFDLSLREDWKLEHLVGECEPLPRVHPMVRDLYPNLQGLHRSILSYMICRCLWLARLTKRM